MLKVDVIFQRIACACTTITLATKRQNNQKQSDLDPSNLGKIKRVYCRKRWLVETPVTFLKTLYHEFGIHVIFKFPRIILAHFFFMRRYYMSENPYVRQMGGDMRQDKKMARICVTFSLATWATFFF
jgi:hypothetical protein